MARELLSLQGRAGSALSEGLGGAFTRVLQSSFAFSGRRTLDIGVVPLAYGSEWRCHQE